jgi:glycosyltransferase involved in cell wall biosynthesis
MRIMIFFYQSVIPHYRIDVFNSLHDQLNNDELVMVYGINPYGKGLLTNHEESFRFRTCVVKNIWFLNGKALFQNFLSPFYKMGKPSAVIIEHNPRNTHLIFLYLVCRIFNIPFILHGHGGSRKRCIHDKGFKNYVHRIMVQKCDAYISYTSSIKKNLSKIKKNESIFVANNTINICALKKIRKKLCSIEKKDIKRKMDMKCKYYVLYIGRFIRDKKIELVLDVVNYLQERKIDVGAVMIGDGDILQEIENYAKDIGVKNVKFTGSISDWEESSSYIFNSDVLFMPGFVGLSVNHAFSFGVPVVSTKTDNGGPFHSPEVDFIIHKETGILVNCNIKEYADAIESVFLNREFYYQKTTEYADRNLTLERMIYGFIECIDYVKKLK